MFSRKEMSPDFLWFVVRSVLVNLRLLRAPLVYGVFSLLTFF